jgi:prepilin-type N-terminal cleavage/methylation domain-containing protein
MKLVLDRPRRREGSGFSLLELMFALSILAVAIGAAFSGQVGSSKLLETSAETRVALQDLRTAMEDVLADPTPEDLPLVGSAYQAGQPVAAYEGLHLRDQRLVATYPNFTGGTVPDSLQVRLTMTWLDANGNPRLQDLVTVVTR